MANSEYITADEFEDAFLRRKEPKKPLGVSLLPAETVEKQLVGSVMSKGGRIEPPGSFRQLISLPEVVLSMLAKGAFEEPVIGWAGIDKLLRSKVESGEYSADEADKVMRELRAKLDPYFSPRTRGAKAAQETIAGGAASTIGPIAEFGREEIVEPLAEYAGQGGKYPELAGATGATLTALPEYALSFGIPGVKTTLKGVGYTGKVLGKKIGLKPDFMARYTPTFTQRGAARKASKFWRENLGETNPVDLKTARWLEDKTGIKFDIGGLTEDPRILRAMSGARGRSAPLDEALVFRQQENIKKLQDYIKNIKAPGDPKRLIRILEAERAERGLGAVVSEIDMENQINRIKATPMTPEETGIALRNEFESLERSARRRVTPLFDKLPKDINNVTPMLEDMYNVLKPESIAETFIRNVPSEVWNGINGIIRTKGFISAKDLYNIRKTWSRKLRDMYKGDRNVFAESRMEKLIGIVDDALVKWKIPEGEVGNQFREARNAFLKEVVIPYQSSGLRSVKRKFQQDSYVSDAELAGLFFKKGNAGIAAARQFTEAAAGNENAFTALRSYIDDDLLHSVYDFNTKKVSSSQLNNWIDSHRKALEHLGWLDDYTDMQKIQNRIDEAYQYVDDFDKLRVSKILEADAGKAMDALLSSSTPARDIEQMLQRVPQIAGDERAMRGLQNAFIDRMKSVSIDSINDTKKLDEMFNKYKDVYKILFKNEPEKLQAMNVYRLAMKKTLAKSPLKDNLESLGAVFKNYYREPLYANSVINAFQYLVVRAIPDIGKEKVRTLITEAAIDPDFAFMLKKFGRDLRTKPTSAKREMWRYIKKVSIPAALKATTDYSKKWEEENE